MRGGDREARVEERALGDEHVPGEQRAHAGEKQDRVREAAAARRGAEERGSGRDASANEKKRRATSARGGRVDGESRRRARETHPFPRRRRGAVRVVRVVHLRAWATRPVRPRESGAGAEDNDILNANDARETTRREVERQPVGSRAIRWAIVSARLASGHLTRPAPRHLVMATSSPRAVFAPSRAPPPTPVPRVRLAPNASCPPASPPRSPPSPPPARASPPRASAARGFAARAARKGKVAGSATLGPVRRTAAPRAAKPSARRGARVVTAAAADDEEEGARANDPTPPRTRAETRERDGVSLPGTRRERFRARDRTIRSLRRD